MREIGSEFWETPVGNGEGIIKPNNIIDEQFVFSGRTAIDLILKTEQNIRKAMLPSYICESVITPFLDANIEVSFYQVECRNGMVFDLNIEPDTDCLFWCNYFGYKSQMPDLSNFIKRGGIVIEDITHSYFSKQQSNEQSHYLLASLRKWEPVICGGYCASRKKAFESESLRSPSKVYIKKKQDAMRLKRKYLFSKKEVDKNDYLTMFSESNKWLSKNFSSLLIDDFSLEYFSHIDYQKEYEKRRYNAMILHENLKGHDDIELLFEADEMDCPLFVPIIIRNGLRDIVQRRLIENDIYCPVHWAKPNMNCNSNLYEMEISLICDQRYEKRDMQRIIDILCKK